MSDLRNCSNLGCRSQQPESSMVRKQTAAKPFWRLICKRCADRAKPAASRVAQAA
jgi:hypothetical protein